MDNKEFDDIIKKKLEDLSTPNDGSAGWDALRDKWYERQVANDPADVDHIDDELEHEIKDKLQNLEMPYNADHWARLRQELLSRAAYKRNLYLAKTVELLALFILSWSVVSIVPMRTEEYRLPFADVPAVASLYHKVDLLPTVELKRVVRSSTSPSQSLLLSQVVDQLKTARQSTRRNLSAFDLIFDWVYHVYELGPSVFQADRRDIITEPIATITPILQSPHESVVSLPSIITNDHEINASPSRKYLSISGGPSVSMVASPFDPVFRTDAQRTYNTDYSALLRYEHPLSRRLGLLAGIGYTKVSYDPFGKEEFIADRSRNGSAHHLSFQNVAYHIINVPIGVKYDLVQHSTHDLYLVGGVELNALVYADYELLKRGTNSGSTASFAPSAPPEPAVYNSSKLSTKDFERGLLQGGDLANSLYAAAFVGVGYHQHITDRFSLQLEPRYSYHLTSGGLGPDGDRIHALALSVGLRYQLVD